MAAARVGVAGRTLVACSSPIRIFDEVEAEEDRVLDLCVAEVKGTAAVPPKLKMRVDGRNEVFQQWGLPEDEPLHGESSLKRVVVGRGRVFPLYYHGPPSFDLDEESAVEPGRHTSAPAADLEWSANILSIKVLHSAVGYPIHLYGSVFVRDNLDLKRVYLFHRDRDSAQCVESPEDTLILTGPSRGLVLDDSLFFVFKLKMRCEKQADGDDMDFSQGRLEYDHRGTVKPMLLTNKLRTNVGTIGISYALVSRAVEATVQIKAPQQGFSTKFYGKISAFVSSGIHDEILLFDSEACGGVIEIGDDGIKLFRRVVSVPIHGSLVLRVDTWEGDDSKAELRASSTTIFTPQLCGRDVASIHGPMLIKVTWSPLYISEYDDALGFGVLCGSH